MDSTETKGKCQCAYDKGWSWVVAFASMVLIMLTMGFDNNLGIIMVQMKEEFGASTVQTSLVLTIGGAAASVTSLLVNTFAGGILHERALVPLGGLILGCGLIFSYFATSLAHMLASIGIGIGAASTIGFGCGLTILVVHFKKRLALANCIAASGASLSFFLFPPLMNYLVEVYNFRWALMIMGGLVFNCFVCAAVMRPTVNQHGCPTCTRIKVPDTALDEQSGGENSKSETSSSTKVDVGDNEESISALLEGGMENNANRSLATGSVSESRRHDTVAVDKKQARKSVCVKFVLLEDDVENNVNGNLGTESVSESRRHDTVAVDKKQAGKSVCVKLSNMVKQFAVRPRKQESEFRFKDMFGLTLWKNPSFVVFQVYVFLGTVACDTVIQFTPLKAEDIGFSESDASVLMAVFGVGDFVGRLLFGVFGDRERIDSYKATLVGISQIIMGITANIAVLSTSLWSQAIFCAILGIQEGLFYSTTAVVLIDLFGSSHISGMLGMSLFFQGLAKTVDGPFMGWLRDVTGSYTVPFHVLGSCSLIAGLGVVLLPVIKKLGNRRSYSLEQRSS